MGTASSNLTDKFPFVGKGKESKILMLGLDSAGKTTILNRLKGGKSHDSVPTIGFNVETVSPVKNVSFTVWDVGGQDKMRPLWRHHYQECGGLIFVTDSSDVERVSLARSEFSKIISDEEMKGVPVLLLANKQDLCTALTADQLSVRFGMEDIQGREWCVHAVSGLTGLGIKESMEKLARMVKNFEQGS